MMRSCVPFALLLFALLLFFFTSLLPAEALLPADSRLTAEEESSCPDAYRASPEHELPLLFSGISDKGRRIGLGVSGSGMAAGMALSVFGIQQIAQSAVEGFSSPSLQTGIILTGSGVLFSAIFTVVFEWFLRAEAE